MRAGPGFARVAAFSMRPEDAPRQLALLEQRVAGKFSAIDAIPGDVVGEWQPKTNQTLEGATLGNGRIQAQWRLVAGDSAQVQLLLEFGSTTAIGPFGFGVRPPTGYRVDARRLLTGRNGVAPMPVPVAGTIAGVASGGVALALYSTAFLPLGAFLLGGAIVSSMVSGDIALFQLEMPVRSVL